MSKIITVSVEIPDSVLAIAAIIASVANSTIVFIDMVTTAFAVAAIVASVSETYHCFAT